MALFAAEKNINKKSLKKLTGRHNFCFASSLCHEHSLIEHSSRLSIAWSVPPLFTFFHPSGTVHCAVIRKKQLKID